MKNQPDLILASGSYVRRTLLERACIDHRVVAPDMDEAPIKQQAAKDGLNPGETAMMLAVAKSAKIGADYPEAHVIGADQMLSCDGRLFDKPVGRDGLVDHLSFLQGRTHQLHTATVVTRAGEVIWRNLSEPSLTMRPMSRQEIRDHADHVDEAVLSSVGGYRIEAEGIRHFTEISGDWQAILGMPMIPLIRFLRTRDIVT